MEVICMLVAKQTIHSLIRSLYADSLCLQQDGKFSYTVTFVAPVNLKNSKGLLGKSHKSII